MRKVKLFNQLAKAQSSNMALLFQFQVSKYSCQYKASMSAYF